MTFARSRYPLPVAFGLVAAGLSLLGLAEPAGAISVAVLLTVFYLYLFARARRARRRDVRRGIVD